MENLQLGVLCGQETATYLRRSRRLRRARVMKGGYFAEKNSLYKLTLGLDRKITPKTSITFGLTYNIYVTDTNSKYYSDTFSSLVPYSFTNSTSSSGTNVKTWVGGKIGIRFL